MMNNLFNITKLIARAQIISFGHYILANGIHSPYFIDFTLLSNKPNYLDLLIRYVSEYLEDKNIIDEIDKIVGILDKGVIIAIPLAVRKKLPFALFSLKAKDITVGSLDVNEKILLVDDMLSTGKTVCKVMDILRKKYGSSIREVFIVLDREEGGFERLKSRGVKVHRLIKIRDIAEMLLDYGAISEEEYEMISNHLKEVKSMK